MLIDAAKAFDKIQHLCDKKLNKLGYRKNIAQHNEGHI
jgi:hypothetical protein